MGKHELGGNSYEAMREALAVGARRIVPPSALYRAYVDARIASPRTGDDPDWPPPRNAHTLSALLARLRDAQKAWCAFTAVDMIASVWAGWAATEARPETLAIYTLDRARRAIDSAASTAPGAPAFTATTIMLKRSLGELAIDAARMEATHLAGLLPALPGAVASGASSTSPQADLRSPIDRVRARSAAQECLIALEHLVRLALALRGEMDDRLDLPTLASFAIQSSAHAAAHAFSPADAIEVNEIPANGAYGFRFRHAWWDYAARWYTQWWRACRARLAFADADTAELA